MKIVVRVKYVPEATGGRRFADDRIVGRDDVDGAWASWWVMPKSSTCRHGTHHLQPAPARAVAPEVTPSAAAEREPQAV